jgi:hypothetical protein
MSRSGTDATFVAELNQTVRENPNIPVALARNITAALTDLPETLQRVVMGLSIDLDSSVPLIGCAGVPRLPFKIHPGLFELADPNPDKPVPEQMIGQILVDMVQFPLLIQRAHIVESLVAAGLLEEKAEMNPRRNALIEYAAYLYLPQALRHKLDDPQYAAKKSAREFVLGRASEALRTQAGYEPVADLIQFALDLSPESSFTERQRLAKAAASMPSYNDLAAVAALNDVVELGMFTKLLLTRVGGISSTPPTQLRELLQKRIAEAQTPEAVAATIIELSHLSNLGLSPFHNPSPQTFEDWLENLSAPEIWPKFRTLNPTDIDSYVQVVGYLYQARDLLFAQEVQVDLENAIQKVDEKSQIDASQFLADICQLSDILGANPPSLFQLMTLKGLMHFAEGILSTEDHEALSPERLRDILSTVPQAKMNREVEEIVYSPRTLHNMELGNLVRRMREGNCTPSDIVLVLRVHTHSAGSSANYSKEDTGKAKYPLSMSEWLQYVVDQGHTAAFGSLVSTNTVEARVREFMKYMEVALPLYAAIGQLSQNPAWEENTEPSLQAAAALIAFNAKPEDILACLRAIHDHAQIPGSIWDRFYRATPDGLEMDASLPADFFGYRDEFLKRMNGIKEKLTIH